MNTPTPLPLPSLMFLWINFTISHVGLTPPLIKISYPLLIFKDIVPEMSSTLLIKNFSYSLLDYSHK